MIECLPGTILQGAKDELWCPQKRGITTTVAATHGLRSARSDRQRRCEPYRWRERVVPMVAPLATLPQTSAPFPWPRIRPPVMTSDSTSRTSWFLSTNAESSLYRGFNNIGRRIQLYVSTFVEMQIAKIAKYMKPGFTHYFHPLHNIFTHNPISILKLLVFLPHIVAGYSCYFLLTTITR